MLVEKCHEYFMHVCNFSLCTSLYSRFEEIVKRDNVEYHAGGSTQNSVKIAQVSLLLPSTVCLCIHWYARNLKFVSLAALGIESIAAQHVDTLQL